MPSKKFTRTYLRVTDIFHSDDTPQAAASTAERITPSVIQEAEIENDDDVDFHIDLGCQQNMIARMPSTVVTSVPKLLTRIFYTWPLKSG
jgi:hypothetical protein